MGGAGLAAVLGVLDAVGHVVVWLLPSPASRCLALENVFIYSKLIYLNDKYQQR